MTATATITGDQRTNGYPKRCRTCEKRVEAGEGVIYRASRDDVWATFCKDHAPLPLGACEARQAELDRKRQARTLDADGSLWTPREFAQVCKAFPGARWHAERMCWRVSLDPETLPVVVELCQRHGIAYPKSLEEAIAEAKEEAIGGDYPEVPDCVYPYQREGIEYLRGRPRAMLGDAMGLGKAQPLDAKILTPSGWMLMEHIRVGDLVIGSDGKPTVVVGVFPQGVRPTYKVTFTDGSSTECDEEHLWYVETPTQRMQKKPGRTMTLSRIMRAGWKSKSGNSKFFIPICQAVEFDGEELPIHPYALGYLLGNGCFRQNTISVSTAEPEMPTVLGRLLAPLSVQLHHRSHNGIDYRIVSDETQQNLLTRAIKNLGLYGLYSEEKFIPEGYLFADRHSREQLLQGLMDSDGDAAKYAPQFNTSSPRLAKDVQHLVMSLGGTCKINRKFAPTYTHKGEVRVGLDAYRMTACVPNDVKPFSLARKAELVVERTKYFPRRAIELVEYVGEKECQCIAVAATDNLYVTDDFIVTHNTIQALLSLPEGARAIVVCPASLKLNWAREIAGGPGKRAWRPDLTATVLTGKQKSIRVPREGEVLILNYDILPPEAAVDRLSGDDLEALADTQVIFDECQKMKRYKAIRHKRGKSLAGVCGGAWLLTGTPIMNRPFDLKGVLEVGDLFRKSFGSFGRFTQEFGGYKNKWGGWEWEGPSELVPELLRKVMLRRLTEDVLPDLPEKQYSDIPVEIEAGEKELRGLLDDAMDDYGDRLRDGKLPPFEEYSKLRQRLAASKIPAMLEHVEDYEEAEEPLVVFSAHRAPVEELAKRDGWAVIYGDTPKDRRQAIVERFQDGGLKGIALTIAAGGEGLTLTRARTCLFVDLDWTPAMNSQAEARIRRIGSAKGHVTYVRLVCDHPIERRVHDLLTEKTAMHEEALDSRMETPFTVNRPIAAPAAVETDEEFAARMAKMAEEEGAREAEKAEKERKRIEARDARIALEDDYRELLKQSNAEGNRRRAAAIRDREAAKAAASGHVLPPLTAARAQAVREAMAYLASVCDHAQARDGAGFSKSDAGLGHILASAGLEDGSDALEAAQFICHRYRRQLEGRWPILWSYDDLPAAIVEALAG